MKLFPAFCALAAFAAAPLLAVYAPIPEQDQGKDLVVTLRAAVSYDSNIFGGATDAISSPIFEVAPRIAFNHSLSDQTFVSANYGLLVSRIENRPGDRVLDSHDLSLRAAHAFSKATNVDVSNLFMVARNPEALLNGLPLNTDQSFTRNQFDARFATAVTPKIGLQVKARSVYSKYRNAILGRSLDRIENLYGLAGDYAILPEVKAIAEFRHLDVYYRKLGEEKNKQSNYLMTGVDYAAARKVTLSARLGAEWRERAREDDVTSPYAELSGRYQYAEQSFVVGGYAYTLDESSDTARFTDQRGHRLFVNLQHALTPLLVASLSAEYAPAELQGRRSRGQVDVDEDSARTGAALSYLPTKNWVVSAHYDYDRVRSDDASRGLERHRVGLSATYAF